MSQHWDPDSEKTPPCSIEEQNALAREINHTTDFDIATDLFDLWLVYVNDSSDDNLAAFDARKDEVTKKQFKIFTHIRNHYSNRLNEAIIK